MKMATSHQDDDRSMSDNSAIQVKTDTDIAPVRDGGDCGGSQVAVGVPALSDSSAAENASTKGPALDYKSTHPIGSRKVTESVITYHEPIFQSVVNTLFESKKNLTMGKRKLEEENDKSDDGANVAKRRKLETVKSEGGSPMKNRKRCTIENIIERIRKEKTLSRSGNSPCKSELDGKSAASLSTMQESEKHEETIVDNLESKCSELPKPSKAINREESVVKDRDNNVVDNKYDRPKINTGETAPMEGNVCKGSQKAYANVEPILDSLANECSKDNEINSKCENNCVVLKTKKKTLSGDKLGITTPKKTSIFESGKSNGMKNKAVKKKNITLKGEPKVKRSRSVDKEQEKEKKHVKELDSAKNARKKPKSAEAKASKVTTQKKTDGKKQQKVPIALRRKKREASLNAATFMNIMYEMDKKSPVKNSKRSKSDSDLISATMKAPEFSYSVGDLTNLKSEDALKVPTEAIVQDLNQIADQQCKSEEQRVNTIPKRKISFSDECFVSLKLEKCETIKEKSVKKASKQTTETIKDMLKSTKCATIKKKMKSKLEEKSEDQRVKPDKAQIKNKVSGETAVLSPEMAEKKRKANLARIQKAKELMKTEKLQLGKQLQKEEEEEAVVLDADEKSDSVKSPDDESLPDSSVKKIKAKRGELFRAARTHVSVEHKLVPESNPSSSPKWCDCCQTSYYPSPPQQQSHQFWRTRQLVDRGSSNPPEPIQSSSRHFIAAHTHSHTSCDVRPYSSPTHVPMLDSSAYVSSLVPHGHVTACSACGCGHAGMLHAGQCQSYSLTGIGSLSNVPMLSCQHYSGSYPMPYPHGSYTHCGCATCCSCGSFHTAGQPLLHQPLSPETPILLHRSVQLPMPHETPHSMAIQCSRGESSLPPPPHPVSVQLSHGEPSISTHAHTVQLSHTDSMAHISQPGLHSQREVTLADHASQGEVTNVSISRSNSMSDHEFIDVGKDDVVKGSTLNDLSQPLTLLNRIKKSQNVTQLKKKSESLKKKGVKVDGKNSSQISDKNKLIKKIKQKWNERKSEKDITKKTKLKLLKEKSSDESVKKPRKASVGKDISKKIKKTESQQGSEKSVDCAKKVKPKKDTENTVKEVGEVKKELESEEEEKRSSSEHGWAWHGEGTLKTVINIFDGQPVKRKCYNAICHDDGEVIQLKDCILVCSGRKKKDVPYVAKVTNFWEDPVTEEMMMTVLWYYRPEHTEGGRKPEHKENEVFAAKHRDETLVACIDDKGYVLTYNEYCRFMAEVQRTKYDLPPRKKVVPDPEEGYPDYRIPPVDVDPENVLLCRQVYDFKLKRLLKNPS